MEHDDCTYSDHDYVEGHSVADIIVSEETDGDVRVQVIDQLTDEQRTELLVRGNPEHLLSSLIGTTAVPPEFTLPYLTHRDLGDETDSA